MVVEIKALKPALLDDFLHFFDDIGFVDNPGWSVCYCQFYQNALTNKEWGRCTKEQNRKAAIEKILNNEMNGFIAYLNSEPIGWVNAASKGSYPKFRQIEEIDEAENENIGSIVCFLIDPSHRKQGIASQLLKHVSTEFRAKGYKVLEAYPRKGVSKDPQNYHGPLSMYLSEGFTVYQDFKNMIIVRKEL